MEMRIIEFTNHHSARVLVSFYDLEDNLRHNTYMKMTEGELLDHGFQI